MFMQLSVSSFPHLPKYTWYLVIYTSRIGEKYSISHHLGGKSQSGAFYPPNISLCTTLVNGCIHKSYTFDFIWVNNENLWSGKIWVNSSHSYFYPKNCQVSTSKEPSKTKKNHKFSLDSVNGGHSFFVSNKIEFFYYKLHPNGCPGDDQWSGQIDRWQLMAHPTRLQCHQNVRTRNVWNGPHWILIELVLLYGQLMSTFWEIILTWRQLKILFLRGLIRWEYS